MRRVAFFSGTLMLLGRLLGALLPLPAPAAAFHFSQPFPILRPQILYAKGPPLRNRAAHLNGNLMDAVSVFSAAALAFVRRLVGLHLLGMGALGLHRHGR